MLMLFLSALDFDEKNKFELLYTQYKNLMFYVANNVLNNPQSAEDAVHNSFLKILKIIDKISDVNANKTKNLVSIITKNTALDMLKAEKRMEEFPIDDDFDIADTQQCPVMERIETKADIERLSRCIPKLDYNYQSILELRYLHEFTEKEISFTLGISDKNVSVRLVRAKQKLKVLFMEEMITNE